MAEIFLDNIYLSLLLPLWLFLIIMVGRFFSVYVNKVIIYALTLFSSAFGAILSAGALWKLPADKILDVGFPFIKINDFIIDCGLHVDRVALIFALILFTVSFFVQLFSISYMKDEKKKYRFYAMMNLFNFSMAGLFFSSNLFQLYLFWELAGIASYLLIGFEYGKSQKSNASKRVLIINRIGDVALISAIVLSSYFIYSYAPNKSLVTLSFSDINTISTLVYAYASEPLYEIICGLFILAALVKSAQIPFYNWLQDAMEAKLPVSALLHSSTLVAAGIFLVLKLLPFLTLEQSLLKAIIILGVITALICSFSACAQTNPKKVLAYSTSAHFGLIFIAIAILDIKTALALFIAHAFIKSLLFLTLPKENEKWGYFKFIIFLISGLSLAGIIFSGMISKEMLVLHFGDFGTAIVSIISFLTAFYIIRIALLLADNFGLEKNKINIAELLSLVSLLFLNIVFYIYLHKTAQYKIAEPFWAALTAWICVYILYTKKAFWKVPFFYPIALNGFYLDKMYFFISEKIYVKFANLCNLIDTKIFGNYRPAIAFSKFGVKTFSLIEKYLMNGVVDAISRTFKRISIQDIKSQNGNIQSYNAYAFLIITIILTCLILGYTAIIIYFGG